MLYGLPEVVERLYSHGDESGELGEIRNVRRDEKCSNPGGISGLNSI